MSIALIRVDDRLVHAQVVVGWIEYLQCNRVLVADDWVADDPDRVDLFRMVIPQEVQLDALDIHSLAGDWADLAASPDPTLLLFANPLTLATAVDMGARPASVNLGGMHVAPGRRQWMHGLYASDSEIAAVRRLIGLGIDFEIRLIPTAARQEVDGDFEA